MACTLTTYFAWRQRSSSPYINRFLQPDTIIPKSANPQSLNRYSYVLNNPINASDPTGHYCVGDLEGCRDETGNPVNGAPLYLGQGGGGGGDLPEPNSSFQPPIEPITLPCGGMMTCGQQSPYGYVASLLPFTSSDACYFLTQDPILCDSSTWQNLPSVSLTQPSGCSQGFWSCYDPDAIVWGAGLSGSMPGIYSTAGLEEIVMFSDGTRAVFSYGGEGGSAGAGASGAAYGGVVFNLGDPDDYVGPFGSAGFTVSVLDAGIAASYFWDSSNAPFSAGTTQGVAVGYAPGAQASVWWSSTSYSGIWRSDR